ncbi:HhH-GPD family protein [Isosphaera pallida ATCC 43644]|uniref:DNA-3-methyladenine glycosylase II n=1 Tax=Isosphaera pallida (strain ATCC 43644 / DSM 9630 / IS1B) TaxID=575540 RepID=E8R1Q9_ISOPI|nr:HhH-GPD family protein [Isosphaera pallida ATCC 43644]
MSRPDPPGRTSLNSKDLWSSSLSALLATDDRWAPLVARLGPCDLTPQPPETRFGILVRAIVGQQIAAKAASAIHRRLVLHLADDPESAGRFVTDPQRLLDTSEENLRGLGLSRVKQTYLRALAHAQLNGLEVERLHELPDDEIVARLTAVKGIGRWTAEMFLMFALARPDVFPVGDLAIRVGVARFHHIASPPSPADCLRLAQPWTPHRTLASWYLWRWVEDGQGT